MTTADIVPRNVRRFRLEQGYSISNLARRAGLSKQTLSSIESGNANPTVLTLTMIADALGVNAAHLLTDYGSPVLVRRARDAQWTETRDGLMRELDHIYGLRFGFARTSVFRYSRAENAVIDHRAHRIGTIHHAYVLQGHVAIGPKDDETEVSRGDFIRFPADKPHQTRIYSDIAFLHMVTTVPQT